jgi:poly-gamma-glutamate synthesis protein (capsule biosynthesis protein)
MISALGYLDLAERVHGPIPKPVDFSYVWGAALEEWARAKPDVRIVNLETSITRSEDATPKGINYRMSPENVGCLLAAGIDCCTVANNHVLDWGRAGLAETLAVLRHNGLKTCGAGKDLAEASAPAILEVPRKGRVIVFSCATSSSGVPRDWAAKRDRPGVHLLPDLSDAAADAVAVQVERIHRPGDVVIVSIHWGSNWGYEIPEEHRSFAHALVDRASASIVHGHSTHHAIGLEVYRDRLILYGCGDFLNDYEGISGHEEFRDDLALMYFAKVSPATADLLDLELVPLQIRQFCLNRPSAADAEWIAATLERESRRLGTRLRRVPNGRLGLLREHENTRPAPSRHPTAKARNRAT